MTEVPSENEITKRILKALTDRNAPQTDSRPAWTRYLSTELAKLCPPGALVYGRQWKPEARGEYLCDQVWGQIPPGENVDEYTGLLLAMECEFTGSEAANLDDFCKVLDVSADRRVFIGNLESKKLWPQRDKFVDRLANLVTKHRHLPRDGQVVVVLCEKGGDEAVDAWILRPGKDPERFGTNGDAPNGNAIAASTRR